MEETKTKENEKFDLIEFESNLELFEKLKDRSKNFESKESKELKKQFSINRARNNHFTINTIDTKLNNQPYIIKIQPKKQKSSNNKFFVWCANCGYEKLHFERLQKCPNCRSTLHEKKYLF